MRSAISSCLTPSHVSSIEIKLAPDMIPTAFVEMAVTEAQLFEISAMCGVVKKFKGS